MIKDNQKHFNRAHVVIDALVIILSYILAWHLKFSFGKGTTFSLEMYMNVCFLIIPLYLLLYYVCNLYTSKRIGGRKIEASSNLVFLPIIYITTVNMHEVTIITEK